MHDIARRALDVALGSGASYADVRAVESRDRTLAVKNGVVAQAAEDESFGIGVRVIAHGAWGFAATDDLSASGVEATARLAVEIARASATAKKLEIELAPEPAVRHEWTSPCGVDPFAIPVERQVAVLLEADSEMRREKGITLTEASVVFERSRQLFLSSEGSEIDQVRTVTGAGICCHSFGEAEIQRRSYPNSAGGQFQLKGWELMNEWNLKDHAPRIASECVALHSAAQCPELTGDLILDSSQLGLQIHESVGHPIELDRVLGSEANYAGMSFLTLDQLNRLRYGSEIVNVVCDARWEHGPGIGTFAFDDEGVAAQAVDIIKDGRFVGYMSSRETARQIGQNRSNGTMRAAGWARIPLIRMTNVSLRPGPHSIEEVFDVPHAIYMETNRSWSIDDKRYNFQFGCEIGWEIRNGKRVRMLKNPTYSGISTDFWNSCAAVAGPGHWILWGVPNCGKGQPEQVMGTGHGASPARFTGIRIGGGYQD
jgi:TldD protein